MVLVIVIIELGVLNLFYYFDWRLFEEGKYMDMEEDGNIIVVKKVFFEFFLIFYY